jgi:signal transduction histidine kinase
VAIKNKASTPKWQYYLAAAWLVFTLALAGWWLIFGMRLLRLVSSLENEIAALLIHKQRMLLWEGSVLFICLLGGGVALLYLIFKLKRENRIISEFFATFTHELKTSLASLRLLSESLQEDLKGMEQSVLGDRLVKDTVRLELQLENSLFIANPEASQILIEPLSLKRVIDSVQYQWPDLEVALNQDVIIQADIRLLESIFKNLFQNAVVHGKATKVAIVVSKNQDGEIEVFVRDNGRGFHGQIPLLGEMFKRHSTTSGSGIGLYLVNRLIELQGGRLKFVQEGQQGFGILFTISGELV